jgi:peptidoglycan-associated lipoprotein
MQMNRRLLMTGGLLAAASLAACAHKKPPLSGPGALYGGPGGPGRGGGPLPPPNAAPQGSVDSRPYGGAGVPGSVEDFARSAGDRVYFGYDQYTLTPEASAVLDADAQWLARYPQVAIRIEGNCDERGTREYNLALGARRAESVKAYLVAHGVNPARIATLSYGKERPVDAGDGEQAWAHNRNAHIAVSGGAVGFRGE